MDSLVFLKYRIISSINGSFTFLKKTNLNSLFLPLFLISLAGTLTQCWSSPQRRLFRDHRGKGLTHCVVSCGFPEKPFSRLREVSAS